MATVTTTKYPLSPTLRWVTSDGRLTSESFRVMREVAELVSAVNIADGEITTDMIAAGSITAEKITASKIDADEILQDGTLITDLIAANAVTSVGTAYTESTTIDDNGADDEQTIQTLAFTPVSGQLIVTGTFQARSNPNTSFNTTFRLKRAGVTVRSITVVWPPNNVNFSTTVTLLYIDSSPGTSEVSWTLTQQASAEVSDLFLNGITILAQNNKK